MLRISACHKFGYGLHEYEITGLTVLSPAAFLRNVACSYSNLG